MRHSAIQFGKNTVTKSTVPELMRVEVEKTRRAFKISKDCGLFIVPEVLDYDETKGVAVFERLHGIEPIHDCVSWGEEYNTLAGQLGQSLAVIHRNLTLPSDMIVPLPAGLNLPGNDVYIHGDFSVYNLCVRKKTTNIAILDWQMTAVFGGQATFGTRYFDIMFFISNLFNRPTIRYLFSNPVLPVVLRFIDAYFQEACYEYDSDEFSLYAKNFFSLMKIQLKEHRLGRRRLILMPRSNVMIREFIQLIPKLANVGNFTNQNAKKLTRMQGDDEGL